ncbi:MAG: MipA/OmpV family protein [Kangiellaceae bacterium]|nr:MipA/OmpV family protein [Kangiellaceae bacterium]
MLTYFKNNKFNSRHEIDWFGPVLPLVFICFLPSVHAEKTIEQQSSTSQSLDQDLCVENITSCVEENKLYLGLSVGIGVRTNPLFESNNTPLVLLPQFSFYSGDFFIENLDMGYTVYQSDKTTINLLASPSYDSVFFNSWDPGNLFVEIAAAEGSTMPLFADSSTDRETLISPEELSHRDFSYLAGIEYTQEFEDSEFQINLLSDVTNTHSGSEIRMAYAKKFTDRLKTTVGFSWKDKKLTDYYYGINPNEIIDDRGAYQASASFNPFVRASYSYQLEDGDSWRFSIEYQKLDSEIANSPIVDDKYVATFYLGKTYKF